MKLNWEDNGVTFEAKIEKFVLAVGIVSIPHELEYDPPVWWASVEYDDSTVFSIDDGIPSKKEAQGACEQALEDLIKPVALALGMKE